MFRPRPQRAARRPSAYALWLAPGLAVLLAACPPPRASHHAAQATCAAGRDEVIRTELSFGLSRPHGQPIGDAEFTAFFEREVAERFAPGATIIDAEGRYRDQQGELIRERSKIVIWLHTATPRHEQAIESVRARYREQFAQESVLRADAKACVSY